MSKLLFAGSRTDSVSLVSGIINDIAIVNGSNYIVDTSWVDAGITTAQGYAQGFMTDPASAPQLTAYSVTGGHSFYFHCQFGCASGYYAGGTQPVLFFNDAANNPWVQLYNNGQLQYNAGTSGSPVWTNLGTAAGPIGPQNGYSDVDIQINIGIGGSHTVTLLYGQVVVAGPLSFTQSLFTNVSSFIIGPGVGNYDCAWSQILCTEDASTVGGNVAVCRPTGSGANSQWTGSYIDVNKAITTFTTFNLTAAADQSQSYPMKNVTVPSGSYIFGVFNWIQAKNDGNTPQNIASLIRTAANINHVSASLGTASIGWSQFGARYDSNPDTGAQWSQDSWNSPVQLGFVSKT